MSEPEIAVVGGGPAGLAAAIGLVQVGFSVRVLERRQPPIDKACGEGLMPDALVALEALGVDLEGAGRPFFGISWIDPAVRLEARFPDSPGRGVRRLELQRLLWARAEAMGVDLLSSAAVDGLEMEPGGRYRLRMGAASLRPRFIVGADGLHSSLRRWSGLEDDGQGERRVGVRRHYSARPWSDTVEVHWQDGCEAYVTPVDEETVGVAILWWRRALAQDAAAGGPFDRGLERFPALRDRLSSAKRASSDRGAGPLRQRVRRSTRANLCLLGDAAGYLDAITGEGMAIAFHEAGLLPEALRDGALSSFERRQRRLRRRPELFTRLVLLLSRRPRLRRRVFHALESERSLFERLVAIHCRQASPAPPLLPVLRFGWRLL